MSGGRVVERGNHESLLRAGGEYARLWAMQQADDAASDGGLAESGDDGDARRGALKLSARA